MKICPVGADLFHEEGKAAGQTGRKRNDEANTDFSQLYELAQKLSLRLRSQNSRLLDKFFFFLQNSAEFHENTTDCLVRT